MPTKDKTSAAQPPTSRIIAVDFWRGLCLLMIFIDHVPDSPLSMATLHSFGFSDAAEVFVFLAGFSATLAFSRYFIVGGFLSGVLRVVKRTWELFRAHVLLVFSGAATFAVADTLTDSKTIMEQMNFTPFFVETGTAIMRLLKLSYMPNLTDILPIYIVFVASFPIIWLLLRVSPWLALGVSGAIWLWANITHFSMANYPEGMTWFFSPAAWQFIFVLGAVTYYRREQIALVARNRFVVAGALLVLAGAFIAVAPWTKIQALSAYRLAPAELLTDRDKHDLAFLRILHFAALAIVAYRFLPVQARFWKNRFVYCISLCGRYALPVYCTGVIAALAIDICLATQKPNLAVVILMEIVGLGLLFALAFSLHAGQTVLRRAEIPRAAVKI